MVLALLVTTQAGVRLGSPQAPPCTTRAKSQHSGAGAQQSAGRCAAAQLGSCIPGFSKASGATKQAFIQDWIGSNGSLRSFSSLEGFRVRPLHITNDDGANARTASLVDACRPHRRCSRLSSDPRRRYLEGRMAQDASRDRSCAGDSRDLFALGPGERRAPAMSGDRGTSMRPTCESSP